MLLYFKCFGKKYKYLDKKQLKCYNNLIERNGRTMRKRWVTASYDKDRAAEIAEKYNLNPIAALLAVIRGLKTDEEITSFFAPEPQFTLPPLSMPDMQKAADRINRAIDDFECIAIFGDYDADGVTSTSILYTYFESRGANVIWYIPDRHNEGYGLTVEAADKLHEMGVQLIVTVDNGVSANDACQRAYELGMEVVITDHHKVPDVMPKAEAIVDLHRPDWHGYKELCGAGVAFKLVCAMEGASEEELADDFADLAAIGTISDVMLLRGENRAIVRAGLDVINKRTRAGVNELLDAAGAKDKYMDAVSVAFTISPRINAAGRMGWAGRAVDLLLSEDPYDAHDLALEINEANIERQSIEAKIIEEVDAQLNENPNRRFDPVIVVDSENWHPGVIGIVSSRIVDRYAKPCIIISRMGDGTARGSGRSVEGFSLYEAIKNSEHLLNRYGGHTLAAGLEINEDKIDEFRHEINEYAKTKDIPYQIQDIDLKLNPKHITTDILDAIASLEPFGAGNPQPVFGLYSMVIEDIRPLSGGKHIKLTVSKDGTRIFAMYFGMPEKSFFYSVGDTVDLAVNLDRNEYMGQVRIGVYIRNIRPSASDDVEVLDGLRLFEKILRRERITREEAAKALPQRSICVPVFREIKKRGSWGNEFELLCLKSGFSSDKLCAVACAVEVMVEKGVLERSPTGKVMVNEHSPKVNLEDAELMHYIRSFI